MSAPIHHDVVMDSNAKGPPFVLLLVLADMASPDGVSWPSQEELAWRMRIHESNVGAAQRKALELEPTELEVVKGYFGRVRRNVYRVLTSTSVAVAVDYERIKAVDGPEFRGQRFADDRPIAVARRGPRPTEFGHDERPKAVGPMTKTSEESKTPPNPPPAGGSVEKAKTSRRPTSWRRYRQNARLEAEHLRDVGMSPDEARSTLAERFPKLLPIELDELVAIPARAVVCEECGVGGSRHANDCPTARAA